MGEAFEEKYKDIWLDKWVDKIEFEGTWIHHYLVDRHGNGTRVTTMLVGDQDELEIIEGEEWPSLINRQ